MAARDALHVAIPDGSLAPALDLYYDLIFDEIAKATYKNISAASKEITFNRFDNVGLIFCQGVYKDVPLKITLTPLDTERYQETEFGFSTNSATQKYTYVESGKFYKLHPAALGSSGPVIGVGFPVFEEGAVKEE